MLSRLIITFLCAAAIGSVSDAFMTFDPEPIVFENIELPISISAKLNSKPIEDVTVYIEHPFLSMSDCVIVFRPDDWDVPRKITGVPAPLFVGSSDLPGPLDLDSELLARAVTVGSLPAELSTIDTLKVIRKSIPFRDCVISESRVHTLDTTSPSFNKPGWYYMLFTKDIEIQVFVGECPVDVPCLTKVLVRYGPTVMSLDVSGPVKNSRDYSVTEVTRNTNGLRHTSSPDGNEHKFDFPYGSSLSIDLVNHNDIMNLGVRLILATGYPSPRGLCNIPRDPSPDNRLISSDGKLYDYENEDEAVAFTDSWRIKDEDVLTNPGAKTLIPSIQPGAVCKIPVDPRPKPVDPVPTTTSTASTIYPLPPAPSGYVPPPPPPDVVVEIKKCCQSIFNIPSCNAIVPTEPYIQSCISDAQTSGSYVFSEKMKQEYLAKCCTLTDDMIRDPTKEVIDQGAKIRKECGFGDGTCTNSCSGKGTCTDFGCACSPGFSGMDCSIDLTKSTQYDPTVNEYRINVNITVIQKQMYVSVPSVDKSLVSFVSYLPKPSTVSPHTAKKSQSPSPKSYDNLQEPIFSSAVSLGLPHMVSVAAVVITSYILLL
ncbi:hypothetical protein BASA50_010363 [Batrachochytrium salamandrivorans]|uniref:EGF-like domain-containing protein n=1 Tax=Batrachochytrium salamandrivorans TaxID=1357716 RepID=A0ABQ8EYL0_9FUNG|nr:hypothetical protein BASA60_001055 [Batrachochytrium salamandrivorans]KAH6588942.1 hypothetical protein BASA50_010363 [Batrachochytrium salamandrivorans]KAH9248191.1 hypothetical protein BASA81_014184 [Batrachochytrium salamandrivorans]KAH9266266.1 hypothetical protein BASA83_010744 [Batrachochytrium salamandrivorans]